MKNRITTLMVLSIIFIFSSFSFAYNYTPNFSDYYISSTQQNVDAAANAYFYSNYGITIDHMYMYYDTRDTFDQRGVSTGWLEENYLPNMTGTITFEDTTDFVTIDWWSILPTTYNIYDASDNLIATFNGGNDQLGTSTIFGSIAYLTVTANGGFGQITGLTYNYDGTTDGTNNDINGVPEPATMLLLGLGLMGLAGIRRKMK